MPAGVVMLRAYDNLRAASRPAGATLYRESRAVAITYLKKSDPLPQAIDTATAETVARMLAEIQAGGENAVRRYAHDLDGYAGKIVLDEADFAAAEKTLAPGIKSDLRFARDRVQDFARRQRDSLHEFRAELLRSEEVV